MKIKKKNIHKKREMIDRLKTGLSVGQQKLLKKNESLMKKQLNDSSVKKVKFTKSSEFFKNLQDSQK